AFQAEHGINPDGILGQASLVELNVPAQLRRDQLWINLERLRWLVDDLREAEVTVNVAAAELRVMREGQVHWRTRTQVGRAERATPLLASYINRLTLNPTWTVPPTIFREDKLPEIRNDLAYLERSELSVLDTQGNALDPQTVDWENPGQVVLRQAASAHNPLGQVALRFSNPFSVYLHDTPSQLLFDKSPRVFSSGCVRVEAVDKLLTLLLPEDELQPVQERLATGKTQEYRLSPRAPLLIGYWTVEADADGTLRYAPDTYLHDPHLLRALQQAGH
ncbi:MAG TPA: L,D-transpeptidase family protein, partial [Pseudomonas sp.]|nr:L,D-transpeptidase family protein [Pseudomonas sp.]